MYYFWVSRHYIQNEKFDNGVGLHFFFYFDPLLSSPTVWCLYHIIYVWSCYCVCRMFDLVAMFVEFHSLVFTSDHICLILLLRRLLFFGHGLVDLVDEDGNIIQIYLYLLWSLVLMNCMACGRNRMDHAWTGIVPKRSNANTFLNEIKWGVSWCYVWEKSYPFVGHCLCDYLESQWYCFTNSLSCVCVLCLDGS